MESLALTFTSGWASGVNSYLVVLVLGIADSLNSAVAGVVGGSSALASHAVKAGSRLAINTSPEPFSNILVSSAEDVTVLAVVIFAVQHPVIAASVAMVLLVLGLGVLYFALRLVRRGWRRWKGRDDARPSYA